MPNLNIVCQISDIQLIDNIQIACCFLQGCAQAGTTADNSMTAKNMQKVMFFTSFVEEHGKVVTAVSMAKVSGK